MRLKECCSICDPVAATHCNSQGLGKQCRHRLQQTNHLLLSSCLVSRWCCLLGASRGQRSGTRRMQACCPHNTQSFCDWLTASRMCPALIPHVDMCVLLPYRQLAINQGFKQPQEVWWSVLRDSNTLFTFARQSCCKYNCWLVTFDGHLLTKHSGHKAFLDDIPLVPQGVCVCLLCAVFRPRPGWRSGPTMQLCTTILEKMRRSCVSWQQ